MAVIYKVSIAPGLFYDCTSAKEMDLGIDDEVIVQLDRRQDCGRISAVRTIEENPPESTAAGKQEKPPQNSELSSSRRQNHPGGGSGRKKQKDSQAPKAKGKILRKLSFHDQSRIREKKAREASMYRTAVRKVKEHRLDMKILNCHYSFDKSLVFFLFSAEERIDFRRLVKDLSGALHTRVELRQVGVRDEASLVGGIGCCGRSLCCATMLKRFPAVNVKAVKTQNLSLNPSSVSGNCGRLKCCLRYELEGYREMSKGLPRINSRCQTAEGEGKVIDCNILTGCVRVKLDQDGGRYVDTAADNITKIERKNTPKNKKE